MKYIKTKKAKWSTAIVLLIAISAVFYISWINGATTYTFETEAVSKGSVSNTVTATGTLEATNTVVVGTQVTGIVEKLYVDFNSIVTQGQLIAELDKYNLQVSLDNAQADLDNAQAEYVYQKANMSRMEELYNKNLLAQADYDLATYSYQKSKAVVKSAKANLDRADRNLSYAMIYAPIDGIVINRAVEEGQTVTASMNTPELFTITNMLTVMQVEADIDEADIGMVHDGLRVEFTVDAFPNEVFEGKVSEVRLQPVEVSNVITYTVIISASNEELKLKPGMTAGITVYVEEVNDILTIPGKAIRFMPEQEMMQAYMSSLPEDQRPQRPERPERSGNANMQGEKPSGPMQKSENENMKRVWVKNGDIIRPVQIETGLSDGSNIEVISGLKQGDEIITSMAIADKSDNKEEKSATKSPFMQEQGRGPGGPR